MDKKLTGLMSVFLLSFALFLSLVFLNINVSKTTRASNSLTPSQENSFVLAFPLELKRAENLSSAVTLFVRDAGTKALPQRTITLTTNIGTVEPTTVITDNDGKALATFRCGPSDTGIAKIHAIIDNAVEITKTVTVKCN